LHSISVSPSATTATKEDRGLLELLALVFAERDDSDQLLGGPPKAQLLSIFVSAERDVDHHSD